MPKRPIVRDGGKRLKLPNSGREVWLYDDANREKIREIGATDSGMGGAPARIPDLTRQGLLLGYELQQDDDLDVAVYVGKPLTKAELAAARWLEPQTALLKLPSGKLAVEPNDASRIGPEKPTGKGGFVTVPPGNYRVTLYRVDHEALFREQLTWEGPQEVIVLTPGGTKAHAADDLLPYEDRRTTDWIGKYRVKGTRADALVWFGDYWDTFVLNLDSAAVAKLGLKPGSYIRTQAPATGLTLISAFAKSWSDAEALPLPEGIAADEYGYAALQPMGEWNGAEALFCRRQTTVTRVEAPHHCVWTEAVVEVLEARPQTEAGRGFAPADLRRKQYFDSSFLGLVLMDVLPEAGDVDELPLPKALDLLDKKLAKMGLAPQGDVTWQERIKAERVESTARLYAGQPDMFAAVIAAEGSIEVVFLSELDGGDWVVTGLADELERRIHKAGPTGLPAPHPRIRFQNIDESLAKIAAAHKAALKKSNVTTGPAPQTLDEAAAALERLLDCIRSR